MQVASAPLSDAFAEWSVCVEGDGTQGNGHLVCKWWDPRSRVWAVGRKRIFPGSYTLRNSMLALLVP